MIRKSDEATKKSRFADEIGESYGEKWIELLFSQRRSAQRICDCEQTRATRTDEMPVNLINVQVNTFTNYRPIILLYITRARFLTLV